MDGKDLGEGLSVLLELDPCSVHRDLYGQLITRKVQHRRFVSINIAPIRWFLEICSILIVATQVQQASKLHTKLGKPSQHQKVWKFFLTNYLNAVVYTARWQMFEIFTQSQKLLQITSTFRMHVKIPKNSAIIKILIKRLPGGWMDRFVSMAPISALSSVFTPWQEMPQTF